MRDEFLMSFMYKRKIIFPSIPPCGIPYEIYLFSDRTLPILTTCSVLLIYDQNHCSAVPLSSQFSSFEIKTLWSVVSKAFAKSRKTRQARLSSSRESTFLCIDVQNCKSGWYIFLKSKLVFVNSFTFSQKSNQSV